MGHDVGSLIAFPEGGGANRRCRRDLDGFPVERAIIGPGRRGSVGGEADRREWIGGGELQGEGFLVAATPDAEGGGIQEADHPIAVRLSRGRLDIVAFTAQGVTPVGDVFELARVPGGEF